MLFSGGLVFNVGGLGIAKVESFKCAKLLTVKTSIFVSSLLKQSLWLVDSVNLLSYYMTYWQREPWYFFFQKELWYIIIIIIKSENFTLHTK